MQQSSAQAATCLRQAGATGCTDVTGFGLIGHLGEMTRASQVILIHMHSCNLATGDIRKTLRLIPCMQEGRQNFPEWI